MTEAVKIAVRRRPLTAKETFDKENVAEIDQLGENVLVVDNRHFVFNKIVEPDVAQESIYDELIKPLVEKTLAGYHCTVLAYGQTGTGKTYTMGLESEPKHEHNAGIIPRAFNEIFQKCQDDAATSTNLSVSFIEIYIDKVFDLLSNNSNEQIYFKGQRSISANMRRICSLAEAQQVLVDGNKRRHVRKTEMNSRSSRSHAIFSIKVEKRSGNVTARSALNLVDLAGSEGVRRTNHEGAALNEGVHINKGLLSMSNVIKALSKKLPVIPYRDSVLSSVLQDSLNAKSYLTLLACISPLQKDLSETLFTLRFARDIKEFKMTPQINAIIAEHKKSKTPVKAFKTPMPRKFADHRPMAQSTAMKSFQTFRRPTSYSLPRRSSSCSSNHTRPRVEGTNNNIDDSGDLFEDSSRTVDNNQMKVSGCTSMDSSLESTASEPVRPLPAIKNLQRFADPQPSTSVSPVVRRVLAEFKLDDLVTAAINKGMNTMMQSFALPLMAKIPETLQPDVSRAKSCESLDLDNTILLSQKMDETVIVPSEPDPEPEVLCNNANEPDSMLEITVEMPKAVIVYPYDSSIEDSKASGTDQDEMDQTEQSQLSSSWVESPKKINQKPPPTQFDPAPPVLRQNELQHMTNMAPPVSPIVLRRSRRLTILNQRKQAQEEEERTRNELAASLVQTKSHASRGRGRPRVFRDVTRMLANATNTTTHRSSNPKSQSVTREEDGNNEKQTTTANDAINAHRKNILHILNTGSVKQMQMLPQIGEKTAYSLFTHRTLTGPFPDIESMAKLKFWSGKRYDRFVECNNLH